MPTQHKACTVTHLLTKFQQDKVPPNLYVTLLTRFQDPRTALQYGLRARRQGSSRDPHPLGVPLADCMCWCLQHL